MIRPIVKYHGGKGRLYKWIVPFLPNTPTYCEPFGGAASILLNKEKTQLEIYNDLEYRIFNLLKVVKNDFAEFKDKIKTIPYEKSAYLSHKEIYRSNHFLQLNELDQAIITYVTKRMSRGGNCGTFSWSSRVYSTGPAEIQSWNTALDNLDLIHNRLQNVVLENRDAFCVISDYDSDNTLFYFDPPYLHSTRASTDMYMHEMHEHEHISLIEICRSLKGKVVISGYPSDLYDSLGWNKKVKLTSNHSSHKRSKDVKQECLWMNF